MAARCFDLGQPRAILVTLTAACEVMLTEAVRNSQTENEHLQPVEKDRDKKAA